MKRLKYISRFAKDLSASEIEELASYAAQKNEKIGVTGILMAAGGLFFQVIEGPDQAIDELYETLAKDPRHEDLLILQAEFNISRRIFPDWAMRAMVIDQERSIKLSPLHAMLKTILNLEREQSRLTKSLEQALWRELSVHLHE